MFEWLVVIGVLGELLGDGGIFLFSGHLQTIQETELAHLNKEAGDARSSAGKAEERAGKAIKQAGEAYERASKNEKEAARLRKLAEDERIARVKIEESIAWRRLTYAEQKEIGSKLNRFLEQLVAFWYGLGDKEGETFAREIAASVHAAKWKVFAPAAIGHFASSGVPFGSDFPLKTGVEVVSTGEEPALRASSALVKELVNRGFDATESAKIEPPQSEPVVVVNVNVRPEGPQGKAKLRKHK